MVRTFQFSVTHENAEPPTEVIDKDGNMVLTPLIHSETMEEAISKVDPNWLSTNGYRIYKPIRK